MSTLSILMQIGNFYSQFCVACIWKRLHKIYSDKYSMPAWASGEDFLTSEIFQFQENFL